MYRWPHWVGGGTVLDLLLTSANGWIGDARNGGCLGCIDHTMFGVHASEEHGMCQRVKSGHYILGKLTSSSSGS